jgi:RNA polymerase sigma-70 factor (ECF subfamily)
MQDSFIKVYNRIHQFRGGSFKAWLFRVVINTCYDRMRGDRRRRAKMLDGDEILPEHDYRLIDAKPTPHEKAESSELMRMLMSEIRKLPQEQQQVLILCDLEGLAYHEAASVTGSNLGTVKSRLSRARAKMRDALSKNGIVPQAAQLRGQLREQADQRSHYGYRPAMMGATD